MRPVFRIEKVGRFRRSAARGMARAGCPVWLIVLALGVKRETAQAIVDCREAPASLWNAAQLALFRETGR